MTASELADLIRERAIGRARFLIGIAGPPGAGKSALAANLVQELGAGAKVVPMDGFHYDDAVLGVRGLQSRKGAPETYDVEGFLHLIARLRSGAEVAIPVFDRSIELSRAAADVVTLSDRLLVIEGNYLLLNDPPWGDLAPRLDLTVFIDVPEPELERRLQQRWADHGKSIAEARVWIDTNDLPNIRRVKQGSRPADVVVRWH